jgi:threonylcarbamoyladenosine tRNA methylthiotransferase MtaB
MVGCRLNQSEIEMFARQFRSAGHSLVGEAAEADLVVINTCSVTASAASDSRQKARNAHRAGVRQIALTGCWSTLAPQAAADLPGVIAVIPNAEKETLVHQLLGIPAEEFDLEPSAREALPGARLRTRAFIKVQDGCDNRCTFCVTTLARGASRSRPVEDVLADVEAAVLGGAQEAVLTGVHLGAWGHDLAARSSLKNLITAVLERSEIPRLRLSSLEPWDLDEDFFPGGEKAPCRDAARKYAEKKNQKQGNDGAELGNRNGQISVGMKRIGQHRKDAVQQVDHPADEPERNRQR